MKRALIFGGSGFLGNHVVEELYKSSYDVTVVDIKKPKNSKVTFINKNVMDDVNISFENYDYVFNFIAQPDIQASKDEVELTFNLNVILNIKILEKIKNLKQTQYIYSSSAYATSASGLFYGISKWSSERIIEQYSKTYGLKYTILRYGSVYGPGSAKTNRVYRFIKEAQEKRKICFDGSGDEVREFIHVVDAARLTKIAIEEHEPNKSFILTGIEKYSYRQLLVMIKEIFNGDLEIEFNNKDYEGHYLITPYQISRSVSKKIILTEYHDMGQGIMEIVSEISDKIDDEDFK